MRSFRLVPDNTQIHFMHYEYLGYAVSAFLILLTLVLVPLKGLNFGIDFRGGILMEVRTPGPAADLAAMRAELGGLGLGEVALQTFGEPNDVLIRIQRQEGAEDAQQVAVDKVKAKLGDQIILPPGRVRRAEGELGAVLGRGAGGRVLVHCDPCLHLVPIRVAVWHRRDSRLDPRHRHDGGRVLRVQP